MPDLRAYCPSALPGATMLLLDRAEAHHLVHVHRARPGAAVVAFDGRGREWECERGAESRAGVELRVRAERLCPPLPWRLTLAQAVPKGSVMRDIVRQATEIGAAEIVPLLTARTVVQVAPGRGEAKADKWQEAAVEAGKQCGSPWLPRLAPVQALATYLRATAGSPGLKLVASLHPGARPLRTALAAARAASESPIREAAWLVGPEGDFTPAELAAAAAAGFTPVTLGPLVLRCDTAALAALAVLAHELSP